MATAYLVRDCVFDRVLALKQLELGGPEALRLFRAEFAWLAGLSHPRLTRVYDFGSVATDQGPSHYYTADFIDGTTLDRFAIARDWSQVVQPLCDALHGLAFLHELGLRHGDFKPQNVIVGADRRGTLIDLGCAALLREAALQLSGTPAYLAPELLEGAPVDGRTDLFSVGVAIEELARRTDGPPPAAVSRLAARLIRPSRRERPSEASEVLDLLGDRQPVLRAPGGSAPQLLGRDDELQRFEGALQDWAAGQSGPRGWLLHGVAGVGKSRLLSEMKWSAQLRATVVEGFASERTPVHSMLARATGRNDLPSGVAGVLAAHDELKARGRGVVLSLDDVDRLDEESAGNFEVLLRCVQHDDVLFLMAASRAEPAVRNTALNIVPVEPLGVAEVGTWAGALVSPQRFGELHRLTGGVPASVASMLCQIAQGRRTESELSEVLGRAGALDGEGSTSSRSGCGDVAGLAEEQQRALCTMAILDGVVEESRWPGHAPREALMGLAAAGFVSREQSSWRLASISDAAVLVQSLPAPLVVEQHADLARLFLQQAQVASADSPDEDRDLAAAVHHLTASRQLTAAEKLFTAAEARTRRAPALWSRSGEPLGQRSHSAKVLLALASVHAAAGRPEAGLRALARLVRREPARRFDVDCCFVAGRCTYGLGRSKRALRYLERALTAAAAPGDGIDEKRSAIIELLVRVRIQRGEYPEALELARAELGRCREPTLRASFAQGTGIAAGYLGDMVTARAQLSLAAELQGRAGSARERVRSHSYLAILEYRGGQLEPAIEQYRAAVAVAEEHGLSLMLATTLLNLGTACQRQGDWGAGLGHYERALRLACALGRRSTEATLRLNIANLYTEIGSFDRGLAALGRVRYLAEAAGLTHVEGMMLVIEGEVALARGELGEARAKFTRARSFYGERRSNRERVEAELHLAEVALTAGDTAAAAQQVDRSRTDCSALGAADLEAQLTLVEGRCAVAQGELGDALTLLQHALALYEQAQQPLGTAAVHAALAAAHEAEGDGEPCEEHRTRARQLWEQVAATLPASLRDAFWRHHRRAELISPTQPVFAAPLADTEHPSADRAALTRFLAINQRINSSLAVDRVLEFAMDAAIELTGAERGFVLVASQGEAQDEVVEVAVARNLDRELVGQDNYEFSTSIAERVLRAGQPIITVDARSDSRFAAHRSVHVMRLQSVACVPIRSPDGTLGALYLDNRFQRGRFSAADADLLVALADQVAIALRNARMHGALQQRTRSLEVEKRAVERRSRGQAREIERLHREVQTRQHALEYRYDYSQIVGRSAPMRDVLSTLDRVIDSPLSLLIQGESGTGKELIARAVHYNSPRREQPFVSINCAALPETLLESELFGHVRGAFTGAGDDKEGLMVAASGGTLFLDEIGDMPLSMQVKLLRALQEREIRPLGGTEVVPIDVRLVSATHRDLSAAVQEGAFREDLFYRMSVVVLELPALRERAEDIPPLAAAIVERLAKAAGGTTPSVSQTALRALMQHRWPGNVRQLENVLSKAYYLSDRERIGPADLDLPRHGKAPRRRLDRRQYEREEAQRIVDALHQTRWNVSAVSRTLGIPRNTLYRKLRKYGIARRSEAPDPG